MSDWPDSRMPVPNIISTYNTASIGAIIGAMEFLTAPSSATMVQNQAYYHPFRLDQSAVAVKMACLIGGTANGNIDVGIYDGEFNYLISSGATGQGSTNTVQEFNITDTLLPQGNYWMAVSLSSATGTVFRFGIADEIVVPQGAAITQASAHPLPTTTATPVKSPDATVQIGVCMAVAFDTLI